jgi:LAO/AO transport system kinase
VTQQGSGGAVGPPAGQSMAAPRGQQDLGALVERLRSGDGRAVGRLISLVENGAKAELREVAEALNPLTGGAMVLGLTGSPGVGKSTLASVLVSAYRAAGRKVGVLAVDPSSPFTGGALLGDRVRMQQHAGDAGVYIRSMATRGHLGGLAWATPQAVRVLDAAGCEVVLVETVGVGQSETVVADMVDCFLLLAAPGGGDELQGIKRGIMELADVVVVNKADGDLEPAARRAVADYSYAVHLLRPKHPGWTVPVVAASALTGVGIGEAWAEVERFHAHVRAAGGLDRLRAEQAVAWMWAEMRERLVESLRRDERVAKRLTEVEGDVRAGRVSPTTAAHELLAAHGVDDTDDA